MPENPMIIVSGLPRSGTSLMMQMLAAGGLEVVTDNVRQRDVDNPLGYYELEKVKQIAKDCTWLAEMPGKVFKMVSTLLPQLPGGYAYRIVFMQRDLQELIASQTKMLQRRQTRGTDLNHEQMMRLYERHLQEVDRRLRRQPDTAVFYASYNRLLAEPRPVVEPLLAFLERSLDVEKMLAVVDAALYRNRACAPAEPRA